MAVNFFTPNNHPNSYDLFESFQVNAQLDRTEDLLNTYIEEDKNITSIIDKDNLKHIIYNSHQNKYLFNKVLFKAVKKIDYDIVFALIDAKKVDVNAIDENLITPLFYCCQNYQSDDQLDGYQSNGFQSDDYLCKLNDAYLIAELLLKNGANPNLKDDQGDTPLMHATCYSSAEMLQLIISYNALINDKNNQGISALMFAVSNLNLEKTKILINNNADVDDFDNETTTILMETIEQIESRKEDSNDEILDLILDKTQNIDAQDILGETALMKTETVKIAKKLLDKNASLIIRNSLGQTPFLVAARDGLDELVELYINKGATTSEVDSNGWTALMLAAHSNNSQPTIKKLLPYSAEIITKESNLKLTALKIAVYNIDNTVTSILLNNGALPESCDKENISFSRKNFTNIEINIREFQEGNMYRVYSNQELIYSFNLYD